ncbi:aminoglycoside phosphotransferase family protein [uncultured Granulicatella sp.]|uniref:aminoglycoside phosphotransferase family protein n=1 Tax=uncultured Granulicatella sp. TaxID=316089 RepID=UPI0028D2A7D6|nr:aminoglycoside phosphotransferase family protein [uncultured Granulicatella sp.]
MTILDQLEKYPKDLISKGYSEEIKYKVKADKNYFLKISPLSFAKKKDLELKYISYLEKEMKFPNLLEIKFENNSILSLYEWIDGVDFREYVTQLTDKELYQYGIQAGLFLKKIHSISIEEQSLNWYEFYLQKSMRKIESFKKLNQEFTKIEKFINYIQAHQYLLHERPISLCHGDFHVGNMMIDLETKELIIIDLGSLEIGDPIEEFNRMIWNAQLSEEFATGLINGYFDEEKIPEKFWKLMAYYMSCDVVGSIPWAVNYGNNQLPLMLERAKVVLDWFDDFERVIPKFYKRVNFKKDGNL